MGLYGSRIMKIHWCILLVLLSYSWSWDRRHPHNWYIHLAVVSMHPKDESLTYYYLEKQVYIIQYRVHSDPRWQEYKGWNVTGLKRINLTQSKHGQWRHSYLLEEAIFPNINTITLETILTITEHASLPMISSCSQFVMNIN